MISYFEFNSYHSHKLSHRSHSQMAFGRTTNILYLLTCVVNYPAVANVLIMKLNCTPASSAAVERLFSASAQVLTAGRCLFYAGEDA